MGHIDREKILEEIPYWFNNEGFKIKSAGYNHVKSDNKTLILNSSDVEVKICLNRISQKYVIKYKIQHDSDSYTEGCICISTPDVKMAFGLCGNNIVNHQGKYTRDGRYLNIPGRGTGLSGDANLSIYIDDEIKKAVKFLLGLE